jgi:signal transduction histidine kinase
MEKRKNFYLIFKESINNAYKYSNGEMVNVRITADSNMLIMVIADNGIGLEAGKKSLGGNGLKNMEIRAKEIGAQLTVSSLEPKGTKVELQMPIK